MIDDCNINNLAKNDASAVFHPLAIGRSVSPKFIELCMETPCLCPLENTNMATLMLKKDLLSK